MSCKCIEFDRASYFYHIGDHEKIEALRSISLDIYAGEFISLVGASGSGKSTLAKHCNGILVPSAGRVLVNGRDTRNKKVRARLWTEIGLVFQHPEQQLFESTVFDDVAFGPKNMRLTPKEIETAVGRALEWVGMDVQSVADSSPFTLSGGEKRRVAIAGVLAISPAVLVLDEPLAGLDPAGRRMLLKQLKDLHREEGITVLMITHNMDDAASVSDRVIVMDQGTIFASGMAGEVFMPALELETLGLEAPFAARVLRRLSEAGYPVHEGYTLDHAAREIVKIYRNRGGKRA